MPVTTATATITAMTKRRQRDEGEPEVLPKEKTEFVKLETLEKFVRKCVDMTFLNWNVTKIDLILSKGWMSFHVWVIVPDYTDPVVYETGWYWVQWDGTWRIPEVALFKDIQVYQGRLRQLITPVDVSFSFPLSRLFRYVCYDLEQIRIEWLLGATQRKPSYPLRRFVQNPLSDLHQLTRVIWEYAGL